MDLRRLSTFELSRGAHDRPEDGLCAMEAVALLEGLDHSAHPECTCPVIAAFVRRTNDRMSDERRGLLVPLLPRLVGTVAPDRETERAHWVAWRALAGPTADALDALGARHHADRMRTVTLGDWQAAQRAARDARTVAAPESTLVARAAAWAGEAASWVIAGAPIWASEAAASAAASAAQSMDSVRAWQALLDLVDGMLAISDDRKVSEGALGIVMRGRASVHRETVSAG